MTEQQLKDAQVRKGEGPYQVASRLLGKDTSHTEKMALAMAFQAQYNQETNGQDPKMQNLHAGQSLLTEKNYKEVIGRIGNDSLRESINAKLDHSKEQSKPEIKPESEQPTKPADRSSKPAEQPSKPAEQPPAGETPREAGKIDRSRFEKELSDPKVMAAFAGRMHSEVGSQGKDAQLAFAEEVMNRATSRGQSLMQALSGKYYPTSRPGSSSNPSYIETINKALKEGTDTTHGATGNASGKVGFGKGGYQTVRFGGEKFGMEAVDISKGWLKKYEKLRS